MKIVGCDLHTAGGPHQHEKYNVGLSLNNDTEQLGVRHFSRFLRSGLPDSQQFWDSVLTRARRSNLHLQDFPLVDCYRPSFAKKISPEAAPARQFRRRHQAALDRLPPQQAKTGLAGGPGLRCR